MSAEAGWTLAQLWLLAVGSGLAAGVAFASLPLVSPRTGSRLGFRARCLVALLPPLAAGGFSFMDAARRHYELSMALKLYVLSMLTAVALRLIFARWLKRQANRDHRSARRTDRLTPMQVLTLLSTIVVVAACLAVTLAWLPSLWI